MSKVEKKGFSPREITVAINNALCAARAPSRFPFLGEMAEKRLHALREYTTALLEPLKDEIEEDYLRPEEAVFICLAGALYCQQRYVTGSDKVPNGPLAQKMMEKK